MWSSYQQAIFEAVRDTTSNLLINAVAGSGKSTTLVESGRHLSQNAVYAAFAKANVADLQSRVEERHSVLTLHKLGREILQQRYGSRVTRLNAQRERDFVMQRPRLFADQPWVMSDVLQAVSAVKNQGLAKDSFAAWVEENISFKSDNSEPGAPVAPEVLDRFRQSVREVLEWSRSDRTTGISFDDMIWLPYIEDLAWQQFRVAIVDEVQDLNVVQLHLAVASAERIIAAGDPWQAIYAFRGAASDSFDRLRTALSPTELPLSVCYRCAQRIVTAVAQKFRLKIEPSDVAPEGSVERAFLQRVALFPDDVILSRSNRGLGLVAGKLARRSIAFCLADAAFINEELRKLQTSSAVKTVGDGIDKLKGKKLKPSTEFVFGLLEASDPGEAIGAFQTRASRMLAPRQGVPLLSTVHRFKGREANRVLVLVNSFGPQEEQEERNLMYVAMTRARQNLVLLQDQVGFA